MLVLEHRRHGAERLADPEDGDLAGASLSFKVASRWPGYLRDTNWPGATSCAMSQAHVATALKRLLRPHARFDQSSLGRTSARVFLSYEKEARGSLWSSRTTQ